MATKQQLQKRWKTPRGEEISKGVMAALGSGTSVEELSKLVKGLEFSEEIQPALDLRGLRFEELLTLRDLDLSGARLDFAFFGGNFVNCKMVGTVFDGADAKNLTLQIDFTRASFDSANLTGVRFINSVLVEADFTNAKLQRASFQNANCKKAKFVEANMKFTVCAYADLTGADLSGAKLNDASLGGIRVDAQTRFDNADLTGAAMDEPLKIFLSQSTTLGPSQGDYELAEFDAALSILTENNNDGHLNKIIERMKELRPRLQQEPGFDWGTVLAGEFPADLMAEVADAVQEGGSNLG
jgi:uncharacterized protein YjbI with pentapeptide repeats